MKEYMNIAPNIVMNHTQYSINEDPLYRALISANVSEKLALDAISNLNALISMLATKEDIKILRADMNSKFEAVQAQINDGKTETKDLRTEINDLRTDINDLRTLHFKSIMWLSGLMIGSMASIIGAMVVLLD